MLKKSLKYVIIGDGHAGNSAAETLRKGSPGSEIVIISSKPTHYFDHSLLATFLLDKKDITSLYVYPYTWYKENNIRLRLNQTITKVIPDKHELILAHNEHVYYDRLLIASGAKPKLPESLSRYKSLLTVFTDAVDAMKLRERLGTFKHVTMVGGDCIGLHLAGAMLKLGKSVTFVLNEYNFWPLEFDETVKSKLIGCLKKKHIEVVADDMTTEIVKDGAGLNVMTKNGKIIKTDLAFLTSGMVPNIEFLDGSGIDVQTGILVDEYMHTSAQDIWAAGECATVYYPELKDYRQTTGEINAKALGNISARNMLDEKKVVSLAEPGKITIEGEDFITYGWKGFSIDI